MNFKSFLIPPGLHSRQALRLRRVGLAILSYALATALAAVAWAFGSLPLAPALTFAAASLSFNAGLYLAIRLGFNERLRDPSLTRLQILVAISLLMFVVYHMNEGRSIALFGCFVVHLFGFFRLDTRQYITITLYTLAAYALVINLLMHFRPDSIQDVRLEWMSWLGLAGLLPCFTWIGAHIDALRVRLRISEARFRALTEMSSDFYWESDAEHRLTQRASADKKLSSVSMFRQGAHIGERRWEIPHLSPDETGWRAHRATLDAHLPFRDFELSRLGIDGSERHISVSGDPMFDAAGAFLGYRGVGTDISTRKRAEQALRGVLQELRVFADNIPAMTVSWDENLHCRFANRGFLESYGLDAESIVGKSAREVLGADMYSEIEHHFVRVLQGQPLTYQTIRALHCGELRHIEVKLVPHIGDHGKVLGVFSVITDVTDHKRAEDRIQRIAHHDDLTGLPNRLLFNDRLAQAISRARRESRQFALLYLDLDRFKQVNDTLGHDAGDELLRAAAARIGQQLRESDTVARVGGDEFSAILPDVGRRGDAEVVAGKIIAALHMPFEVGNPTRRVDIGASIGIALYPEDAADAAGLVKAGDAAMYRAKQAGANPHARAV